jgi:hypothetical protein
MEGKVMAVPSRTGRWRSQNSVRAWWAALSEIVAPSRGEPSHHGRVRGVSQDAHVDLTASTPELTVQVTMVRGSPCVAKVVQHVPEQGGKTRAVQPITTESSVDSKGGIGVVVHLSKTREK